MTVKEKIEKKLQEKFLPGLLEVEDESHRHIGHAGARPGGESHFRVVIVAPCFAGLDRVARQRVVYELLAEELAGPIHALSLSVFASEEERAKA